MENIKINKTFKMAGFLCIFFASLFISFNLFISAVLPAHSHVASSSQQQKSKKILCLVKYVDTKHGKYQQVTTFLNPFLDFKITTIVFPSRSEISFLKYPLFLSGKDLPVKYCCLLI